MRARRRSAKKKAEDIMDKAKEELGKVGDAAKQKAIDAKEAIKDGLKTVRDKLPF